MSRPVRGLLFDLWNTLAAGTSPVNPVVGLGRRLTAAGADRWLRALENGMMRGRFETIEDALPSIEREAGVTLSGEARAEVAREWREASRSAAVFPEVLPVLERLRGRYRLGILSNTQSFDMEPVAASGLLERVDLVKYSCDTGLLKPDPAAYADALEALGTDPSDTMMVGDRWRDDVDGARRAGLRAVLIRRDGMALSWREAAREPFIRDLHALERMLAEGRDAPERDDGSRHGESAGTPGPADPPEPPPA